MFTTKTTTTIALALTAALSATAADASFTPYSAETYGRASGDMPFRDLGLVLELVHGDTKNPKLRVFGGVPGNQASVMVSGSPDSFQSGGATVLVAGQPMMVSGKFDWMGYFEVSLTDLPDRASGIDKLYAQASHVGAAGIDSAYGTRLELSNGLSFFPTPKKSGPTFKLSNLLPNLPPERISDMERASSIEEKLTVGLNSSGDEMVVKLGAQFSVAFYACANAGPALDLEAKVTRRDDGRYDVEIGADIALKVGLEGYDGLEANVGGGYGGTQIYQFHSVAGVARGLRGIAMALRFPNIQVTRFLTDTGAFDFAKAGIEELRKAHDVANEALVRVEQTIWNVAELRLAKTRDLERVTRSNYERARAALNDARIKTLRLRANLAFRFAVHRAVLADLRVATTKQAAARVALDIAKDAALKAKEAHHLALDLAARVGKMFYAVGQSVMFAKDHFLGSEVRMTNLAEVQVSLGLPISLANTSIGGGIEVKQIKKLRIDRATDISPKRITVTQEFMSHRSVHAGYGGGFDYDIQRTLTLVDAFEIGIGETRWAEHKASLKVDRQAQAICGAGVTRQIGAGRTREMTINQEDLFKNIADIGVLLVEDGLKSATSEMGFTEVGFSMQDRIQDDLVLDIGGSVAGYGAGIKGSVEWSDKGEALFASTSIHDAVEGLIAKIAD